MRNIGGYLKGTTLEAGAWQLRVSLTPPKSLGRFANTFGYYLDDDCDETVRPMVALLPHGRYLAGTTLGEGMSSGVDASWVHETEREAWRAAYDMAEREAEDEREYRASRCAECFDGTRLGYGECPDLCEECYQASGRRTLAHHGWQ